MEVVAIVTRALICRERVLFERHDIVRSNQGFGREREREREAKVGKKTTENLYLLLRSQSETEFRTETSVRKPSIRASYRHIGSHIWWSI